MSDDSTSIVPAAALTAVANEGKVEAKRTPSTDKAVKNSVKRELKFFTPATPLSASSARPVMIKLIPYTDHPVLELPSHELVEINIRVLKVLKFSSADYAIISHAAVNLFEIYSAHRRLKEKNLYCKNTTD